MDCGDDQCSTRLEDTVDLPEHPKEVIDIVEGAVGDDEIDRRTAGKTEVAEVGMVAFDDGIEFAGSTSKLGDAVWIRVDSYCFHAEQCRNEGILVRSDAEFENSACLSGITSDASTDLLAGERAESDGALIIRHQPSVVV